MLANLKRLARHLAGSLVPETSTNTPNHKDPPLSQTVVLDSEAIISGFVARRATTTTQPPLPDDQDLVGQDEVKGVKDDSESGHR
jgi:hypothetical protein